MNYQRRASRNIAVFGVILATYVLAPAPARAGARLGVECSLVEEDMVEVDGMLDDWAGIKAQDAGAFGVRCAQTDHRLLLAISIEDDTIVRTSAKTNNRKQDRFTLAIGTAGSGWSELVALPGTRGFEPVRTWRGKKVRDDVAADSLQRNGWAVELSVPLKQLRGWGPGTPKLRYTIDYRDRGNGSKVNRVRLKGTIRFAGATEIYKNFMTQTRLRRKSVRVDTLADMDGERGVERVIIGGKIVGVINDEYRYLTLPVQSAKDVIVAKVVDLAGEGRASVITQYREHGNGGSRDVVAVWNMGTDGSFSRSLAIEVRKQLGDNVLQNEWRLEPKGMYRTDGKKKKKRKKKKRKKKKKRGQKKAAVKGFDLVVEAGTVTGWDEDSYEDAPPEDMRPILQPWGEQTSAVYYFEADEAYGGEPLP